MNNSPKLSITGLTLTKILYKFKIRETLDLITLNPNITPKPRINFNPFKKNENIIEIYPKKINYPKKKDKQTNNTRIKKIKAKTRKVGYPREKNKLTKEIKAEENKVKTWKISRLGEEDKLTEKIGTKKNKRKTQPKKT